MPQQTTQNRMIEPAIQTAKATSVGIKDLLAVMGENPCELTAKKTAWMMERDKMQVTGFVVTSPTGLIGIVDKSAVRWLTDKEMWWLMHDSPTPIMTANE